jgi:hypothetical protein
VICQLILGDQGELTIIDILKFTFIFNRLQKVGALYKTINAQKGHDKFVIKTIAFHNFKTPSFFG